jgi:hypothetical protein
MSTDAMITCRPFPREMDIPTMLAFLILIIAVLVILQRS